MRWFMLLSLLFPSFLRAQAARPVKAPATQSVTVVELKEKLSAAQAACRTAEEAAARLEKELAAGVESSEGYRRAAAAVLATEQAIKDAQGGPPEGKGAARLAHIK